jgi:hypothetical protein
MLPAEMPSTTSDVSSLFSPLFSLSQFKTVTKILSCVFTVDPDADHVSPPQADSSVGRRLKDLSVFVLQGGRRLGGGLRLVGHLIFGTFSNHQAVSGRVLNDFRTIFNAELYQDPSAISADCFGAK